MRRAAKRDANEPPIVAELRAHGYLVKHQTDYDLIVCKPFEPLTLTILEVKTEDGTLTESQKKMLADGWPLHIVRTPSQAIEAAYKATLLAAAERAGSGRDMG